jgi:hypothetical protein
MSATLASFSAMLLLVLVLCSPPFIAISMVRRRLLQASDDRKAQLRTWLIAAWVAFGFNLAVAVLAPPVIGRGAPVEGLGTIHLVALAVCWLSIWACVALAVFVRRRRLSMV